MHAEPHTDAEATRVARRAKADKKRGLLIRHVEAVAEKLARRLGVGLKVVHGRPGHVGVEVELDDALDFTVTVPFKRAGEVLAAVPALVAAVRAMGPKPGVSVWPRSKREVEARRYKAAAHDPRCRAACANNPTGKAAVYHWIKAGELPSGKTGNCAALAAELEGGAT